MDLGDPPEQSQVPVGIAGLGMIVGQAQVVSRVTHELCRSASMPHAQQGLCCSFDGHAWGKEEAKQCRLQATGVRRPVPGIFKA
jgi:hypothetical protein